MSNQSITDSQEKILADIQNLQNIQSELITYLENNLENGSLTTEKKNELVEKMEKLSNMRVDLYKNLDSTLSFQTKTIDIAQTTLGQQIIASKIIEKQLQEKMALAKGIQKNNNNKVKLIEINTYYTKKYQAYINIMKIIFYIIFLIGIVSLLSKKGLIPDGVFKMLIISLLSLSIIYIIPKIWDIYKRDKMNFDEYNWRFTPPTTDTTNTSSTDSTSTNFYNSPSTDVEPCIGSDCCNNANGDLTWDSTLNKCVPSIQIQPPITTTENNSGTNNTSSLTNSIMNPVTVSGDFSQCSTTEKFSSGYSAF